MYKRQQALHQAGGKGLGRRHVAADGDHPALVPGEGRAGICLLYTSDAADERSSVDLGGRRIIKKTKK